MSAPRPAATIVIPTHDRPELLERAVASALAQTVRDLQVVVVDDGSAEPVRFERPDPRLLVLRNPRALGASVARNLGLEVAAGRWVTPDGGRLVLRTHRRFYQAHPQLFGRQLAILGTSYIRNGRWWPAVQAMTTSLRVDPGRPKALAQWLGTLTGPRLYGSYLEARQRRNGQRAA